LRVGIEPSQLEAQDDLLEFVNVVGTKANKRKPTTPAFGCWAHFNREGDVAIYKHCDQGYKCKSNKYGTNNLNRHVKECEKNHDRKVDKKQKTIVLGKQSESDLDSTISIKLVDFNQEKTRYQLAKMVIIDELAFKFVDNLGFREFMATTNLDLKFLVGSL